MLIGVYFSKLFVSHETGIIREIAWYILYMFYSGKPINQYP